MDAAKKFTDISEYIAAQVAEVQPKLHEIYTWVNELEPKAKPCISYNMPCFKHEGVLIYFAAFKKHYSIFIRPAILQDFKSELSTYVMGKSAVQIPFDRSFPKEILKKILQLAVKRNEEKALSRKKKV